MDLIIPLPKGVRDVVDACAADGWLQGVHLGLVLDKLALSWDDSGITKGLSERVQKPMIEQVVRLSASPPPGLPFDDLVKRWETITAKGVAFTGTTAGPLTLHLARASALENAGICLHPIYGFTYLPGSGLKGLARAFAETVAGVPQEIIRRVFGFTEKEGSAAGSVVFHDAWPKQWPRLVTDILNSHHPEYYSKANEPPGDWEDPVPVYFLSVPPGVPFRFAIAPRRDDIPVADVELAKQWLIGGLTVLGCGAKTATGYGHFKVEGHTPAASPNRPEFTATLELVTPAFLAGANQQWEDCNLRPATLRGQLRWWWRTMHAGFVDVPTLKRMEAAIWGDTKRGGAVRITVTAAGTITPLPFDRQEIIRANRLPPTPDRKTSQGLVYHSYGMDDKPRDRRHYLAPGTKWVGSLVARAGQFLPATTKGKPIDLGADVLLEQAKAAFSLLCHFGGVGAKARKGFGSFADLPGFDLAAIRQGAANFRARCGLGTAKFQDPLAESPSLELLLGPLEVPTGGVNWWLALDQLAAAAQQFAKRYKHRMEKKALGLPRRVGMPTSGTFNPGRHAKKDRHASPVLYHFDKVGGNLVARVVAFPAVELPNLADSRKLLQELLTELGGGLGGRFAEHVTGKPPPAGGRPRRVPQRRPRRS